MKSIIVAVLMVLALPVYAGEPGKSFGSITIPATEAPVTQAYQPTEQPQTVYVQSPPQPSIFDAVKTAVWDWPLGLASRSFRATGTLAADTIDAGRKFGGSVVTSAHYVD